MNPSGDHNAGDTKMAEDMLQCLRAAALADPLNADAHYHLGRALVDAGQYVEAVECCTRAIALNPDHKSAYHLRARARDALGQISPAAADRRRATELAGLKRRATVTQKPVRPLVVAYAPDERPPAGEQNRGDRTPRDTAPRSVAETAPQPDNHSPRGNRVIATAVKSFLPAAVILGSLFGAKWLIDTKPAPPRTSVKSPAPLVEVITAAPETARVHVNAMGIVIPDQTVRIQPEVTGRVVERNPNLLPGGRLEKGDIIVKLDPRDYRFALDAQKARVARAKLDLRIEESRQAVAKREWEAMKADGETAQPDDLALRIPQMQNARAALAAALSGLRQAQLNLERATIRAPINGIIKEEFADIGQLVTPADPIATLVGTDRFRVRISVPVDKLDSIRIPTAGGRGSAVTVIHRAGPGKRIVRKGYVTGILHDVDPKGRMARLLAVVDDPLGLKDPTKPALLLGASVRVEIEAKELRAVYAVPRSALREGDRVWLMDADNRLVVRPVEVAWRRENDVLVRNGIAEGERIILTHIAAPIPGMKLRLPERAGAARQETAP